MYDPKKDLDYFNRFGAEMLPGTLKIEITAAADHLLEARMPVERRLFAPNGFLHAGSIVSLADTAAGYATWAHLPEGSKSFTTLELKSNFTGAARDGHLVATATPEHLGRTTQVWRVEVVHEEKKKMVALFHCTQLILY